MKAFIVSLLSLIIFTVPGCRWAEILASKPGENRASDAGEEAEMVQKPAPEPLLAPGYYDLSAPKAGKSFIVYVPMDYTPEWIWPVIFCYPGAGGKAMVWPFQQVTQGRGFIIVGMNYTSPGYHRYTPELLSAEQEFFFDALSILTEQLSVDPEGIFLGGYSQGGYHTTFLGEALLDKLAGLVILAAGRYASDQRPPLRRSITGKPVFIGVGENDSVHNPRARRAADIYKRWDAKVTFEEWPGVGHGIGTPSFPSKILSGWLEDVYRSKRTESRLETIHLTTAPQNQ